VEAKTEMEGNRNADEDREAWVDCVSFVSMLLLAFLRFLVVLPWTLSFIHQWQNSSLHEH
jgi:hypothetical protein